MTLAEFNQRDINDQASLTAALAWASYKYYIENDPPMSDFEFDMEFKQLQALEAASGIVLPDSPTQRVGSDIQGAFEKHRHVIPMQSIENVYSDEELQQMLSEDLPDDLPHVFISAVANKGLSELKDVLWKALNSESNKLQAISQQETLVHRNKDLAWLRSEMEDEGEDEEIEFIDEEDIEDVEDLEDFEYEDE